MQEVPERWRFSFDDDAVSLHNLSWPQAARVFRDAPAGELAGQSDGECVALEFDPARAAVLFMGPDRVVLRPYFPRRPAAAQDLRPCFCGCGIRLGNHAEYLSRFLLSRADGFRLFAAVLAGPALPPELPEALPGQPMLPGFEAVAVERAAAPAIEWRPLPR